MSDKDPALGSAVLIQGRFIGIDLSKDAAQVQTAGGIVSVPRDRVIDGTTSISDPNAEARWREHRDANVSRGVSVNGISKRDFLAGHAAATA